MKLPDEIAQGRRVCGVYVITHSKSGRKYVGKSKDIASRIRAHASGIKRASIGRRCAQPFHIEAAKLGGVDQFTVEVIKKCSPDSLLSFEQRYIRQLFAIEPCGFNASRDVCKRPIRHVKAIVKSETYSRLEKIADANGISVSDQVAAIIEAAL